jgi:hypothetical protein
MKKTLAILLVLLNTQVFAQTLEEAKTNLANAETALATQEAAVKAARANVAALTPHVYWEKGGFAALNFNSLGLTNWAAGGVSSNSITALGNIFKNYKKDKVEWMNNLELAYGLIQNGEETLRKNEDKIDYLTKGNYSITNKLSYSVLLNFKSQFAPGFDFTAQNLNDDDRPEISKFFAPAYLTTSVGFNYNVTDYFSIYLSPATGRFTFVTDDSIAAQNIYIPATLDDAGNSYYEDNFRTEFGALLNARFAKDLTKKINLTSTLNLFNNYTDVNKNNRLNIDVNWETMINMKLTNYLGASLYTNLIHDNDIAVSLFDGEKPKLDSDGNQLTGPRTQFKRLLGLGVQYKF